MATVFVYGTLTDPDTAAAVLPDYEFRGRATLQGLHRVDGSYPTLAPGGSVAGRLLVTAHLDALDAYEGVESGLYARIEVSMAAGDGAGDETGDPEQSVQTYVGNPTRLDADVSWPDDRPFPACVRECVSEREVRVVPEATTHERTGGHGDAGDS